MPKATPRRKRLLKKLRSIRKKGNYEIYFQDEVHFQRRTSIIRAWALKGVAIEIKSPSVKQKSSFLGAMGADNGQLITMETDQFDAISFKRFIQKILHRAKKSKKRILLVLDNAKYHHARMNLAFFKNIEDKLKLLFLPAYAPELNPIEQLWKKTRRDVTHNKYFESLTQQRELLNNYFKKFGKQNDILTSLSANT